MNFTYQFFCMSLILCGTIIEGKTSYENISIIVEKICYDSNSIKIHFKITSKFHEVRRLSRFSIESIAYGMKLKPDNYDNWIQKNFNMHRNPPIIENDYSIVLLPDTTISVIIKLENKEYINVDDSTIIILKEGNYSYSFKGMISTTSMDFDKHKFSEISGDGKIKVELCDFKQGKN